jgi:hypothetical protein
LANGERYGIHRAGICGNGNFKSEKAFVAAHIFRANNHASTVFKAARRS